MFDSLTTISIVYLIIGVITLIVFFVLAKNVTIIKDNIISIKNLLEKYAIKDGVLSAPKKNPNIWECPKCGFENPNNTSICERCNHKI